MPDGVHHGMFEHRFNAVLHIPVRCIRTVEETLFGNIAQKAIPIVPGKCSRKCFCGMFYLFYLGHKDQFPDRAVQVSEHIQIILPRDDLSGCRKEFSMDCMQDQSFESVTPTFLPFAMFPKTSRRCCSCKAINARAPRKIFFHDLCIIFYCFCGWES